MHGTVHLFDSLPRVSRVAAPLGRTTPLARQIPLVGVIRNRRSHRNGGAPQEWTGRASLLIEVPERRSELPDILARFAERQVDYIVVDGGDGTVRDVLTCGAGVFGESWPPLMVLPNGKTNALATNLGIPADWSLADALDAGRAGRTKSRRPLVVAQRDNDDAQVRGFVFGAGAYTEAIGLGQDAHDRGAFNAFAVGVTAVWGLLQALFGAEDNVWRRGTSMRLRDSQGRELPHSGIGRAHERYLLFASTLDRFPAGLRPFGKVVGELRTAVIDNARLGLLLRTPSVFRGKVGEGLRRRGYHVFALDALELEIGERFILDGEAFPPGRYRLSLGPKLRFVVP
jgi:diacylglycerol kinase (ATP)